jgi:urease accessory protein
LSLSKAYKLPDSGGALLVQAVNPTAGMFAGDLVELRAEVGENAALVLTTPAASRVFSAARAKTGARAITRQTFRVEEGAWLEYLPEIFIPHANSVHRQETEIHLAPGAGLFFLETLAPGRTARGEIFNYTRLEYHAQLHRAGHLIYQERNTLAPETQPDTLHAFKAIFPGAAEPTYYASGLLCPPADLTLPARDFQEAVAALSEPGAIYCGATLLRDNHTWALRALTAGSLPLHKLLPKLRALAHTAVARPLPNLRKL